MIAVSIRMALATWVLLACVFAQGPLYYDAVRRFNAFSFDSESRDKRIVKVSAWDMHTVWLNSEGRLYFNGGLHGSGSIMAAPVLPTPRRFIDVDVERFALAIDDSGQPHVWGSLSPSAPPPLLPSGLHYTKVAAGGRYGLLLRSDGQVVAFGSNDRGQCNVPPMPPGLIAVDVDARGATSAMLLHDGSVMIWGDTSNGQGAIPQLPAGVTFTKISLGSTHVLGLRSDGVIEAWGNNQYGACNVPPLPYGLTCIDCAAGNEQGIAVLSDGTLQVWPFHPLSPLFQLPVPRVKLPILDIGIGTEFAVVVQGDGSVLTWGNDIYHQHHAPRRLLDPRAPRFVGAAAGWHHSAVLTSDGKIEAFGNNYSGQCNVPLLPQGVRYTSVSASGHHTCALRSDGEAVAWGDNSVGQCNIPALPVGMSYVDVVAGWGHTVVVRSDGQAFAFGDNVFGVCNVPPPPPGVRYVKADANYGATMLLRSDGQITLIGDPSPAPTILQVPPLPAGLEYTDLAVGRRGWHAALRSDGEVIVWGSLTFGATYYSRGFPPLPPGVVYVDVDGANELTAALRSDGQIVLAGILPPGSDFVPPLPPDTSYYSVSAHFMADVVARVGPTSTYIAFAPGCAGSRPASRLIPQSTPHIGATHEVRVTELPQHVAIFGFGWSRSPVPTPLQPFGMPGCSSHIRWDTAFLVAGQHHIAKVRLPIPDLLDLIGVRFYHQALVLDPAAGNPLGAVVSAAAEGVIGHW